MSGAGSRGSSDRSERGGLNIGEEGGNPSCKGGKSGGPPRGGSGGGEVAPILLGGGAGAPRGGRGGGD